MADSRPTWQLVLAVTRDLSARHNSFRLADIIEGVQRLDATRARTSIQPVVQGMTSNAGRGPQQPCGKVLMRTEHGWHRLLPAGHTDVPADRPVMRRLAQSTSSRRAPAVVDVGKRVRDVVEAFDKLVEEYDRSVPFQRNGQYERHRETINCRRELGSAEAAIARPAFTALLHETLQLWGIGRRASRLCRLTPSGIASTRSPATWRNSTVSRSRAVSST